MSRHELTPRDADGTVTSGAVGWDRPLQTFFAQLFSIDADGDETAHLWLGTAHRELPTAAAALNIVQRDCVIPDDLGATLELERLASLGAGDGHLQVDIKRRFMRPARPDAGR